jgi:sulfotransferase
VNNGIHFISGLPRSGSTLLATILRQNPRFHATLTSPVSSVFHSLLREVSVQNNLAIAFSERQKRQILMGIFQGYYEGIHESKLIFDTSRLWCTKIPILADLFPGSKVIACVRDVPWIFDSIERLIRRNKFDLSTIFNCDPIGSVYTRAEALASGQGMIGSAFQALRQAYFSEEADRLLLVRYESLTVNPRGTIEQIYDFIGEPIFTHDFDNTGSSEDELDARLGTPGLHTVRPQVRYSPRKTILPPELFNRFAADTFWSDASANVRNVPIV